MARGTPLKWIQEQGGWTTAKVLLDTYGHFMPTESHGFADALAVPPDGSGRPYTAPGSPASEAAFSSRSEVPENSNDPSSTESSTGPRSPIMHVGRPRKE